MDDPFGVGPRFCDQNSGVGGDSCVGFANSAGFFTDPEHMTTGHSGDRPISVSIRTEYTPNTALKIAAENGLALFAYGSDSELAVEAEWFASRGNLDVVYSFVPTEALADGWYSLVVPRAVREAHGAQYQRFAPPALFAGGPFVHLENGDLRADFRVGSQPMLARISAQRDNVNIAFSEDVEATTPPVSVTIGTYTPACEAREWSGTGRGLWMSCSEPLAGYGDPVTVTFTEGFVTSDGTPLLGPDGNTEFSVDVPEDSTVELGVPGVPGE